MNARGARSGLVAVGLLALATALSACHVEVGCATVQKAGTVLVTLEGDDSRADRVFVCATTVKDCVIPRQSGDPIASRGTGPWWVWMNPAGERPAEADVYTVDVHDKVLNKQRVSLTWNTDQVDAQCGDTFKASVTVTLPETKW